MDETKNTLNALTKRSNIEIIFLGRDGAQFKRVAKVINICQYASQLCSTSPLLDSRSLQIVSLHPVYPSESKLINLVVVTSTSCRLYFTHHKRDFPGVSAVSCNDLKAPTGLELIHVRLPPSLETTPKTIGEFNRSQSVSDIHVTFYSSDVLLASNSVSDLIKSSLKN
ncbi:hypothetical protein K7432_013808 [Basidiobolus ranarum]|uniref:Nucleoporin Nup133/Nup155-like N-terminal domain-containing protein n=1 Tax=Basidiobolus ranarum TaxID=34480 RepID=A0ABR2WIT2_9FUNG